MKEKKKIKESIKIPKETIECYTGEALYVYLWSYYENYIENQRINREEVKDCSPIMKKELFIKLGDTGVKTQNEVDIFWNYNVLNFLYKQISKNQIVGKVDKEARQQFLAALKEDEEAIKNGAEYTEIFFEDLKKIYQQATGVDIFALVKYYLNLLYLIDRNENKMIQLTLKELGDLTGETVNTIRKFNTILEDIKVIQVIQYPPTWNSHSCQYIRLPNVYSRYINQYQKLIQTNGIAFAITEYIKKSLSTIIKDMELSEETSIEEIRIEAKKVLEKASKNIEEYIKE